MIGPAGGKPLAGPSGSASLSGHEDHVAVLGCDLLTGFRYASLHQDRPALWRAPDGQRPADGEMFISVIEDMHTGAQS
jgi:hypothetical protein